MVILSLVVWEFLGKFLTNMSDNFGGEGWELPVYTMTPCDLSDKEVIKDHTVKGGRQISTNLSEPVNPSDTVIQWKGD